MGNEYKVPPLPKKLFVTNSFWEKEKSVFFNGMTLCMSATTQKGGTNTQA